MTRTAAAGYDLIVLGAGAAGLLCAAVAGQRGSRVLLVEGSERVGKKILISGGGRCNFTNTGARAENFLSENAHFAKSALARYTPADFVTLVERHGIRYHEKTLGQLFCDDSAGRIVAMLERECDASGNVLLRTGARIVSARHESGGGFLVETNAGTFRAAKLAIATGGPSIPKMGASGIGYDLARGFGHMLVAPRAGLVPLVFNRADRETWCELTGLSAEVVAAAAPAVGARRSAPVPPSFREKLLVTHRGLSGPAALQISSYWSPGGALSFDLAPGQEVFTPLLARRATRDTGALLQALSAVLPLRFARRWLERYAERPDFTNAGIVRLEAALHRWTLTPQDTEGYAKAEVTVGGVDTRELDARTLESRRVPGLYFIGEVVDVTGWLGGYNFQWAWSSAVACGQSV